MISRTDPMIYSLFFLICRAILLVFVLILGQRYKLILKPQNIILEK